MTALNINGMTKKAQQALKRLQELQNISPLRK
jgi:hypothetical protein